VPYSRCSRALDVVALEGSGSGGRGDTRADGVRPFRGGLSTRQQLRVV
jgi:hypothetical protein